MNKEIGKWFLDVAKYIVTAFILTNMFVKIDTFMSAVGAVIIISFWIFILLSYCYTGH
jgi:hypothetical protein